MKDSLGEPRSEYIGVRVTSAERRKLETLAVTSGLGSMSAVVATLLRQCDGILPARAVAKTHTEAQRELAPAHSG